LQIVLPAPHELRIKLAEDALDALLVDSLHEADEHLAVPPTGLAGEVPPQQPPFEKLLEGGTTVSPSVSHVVPPPDGVTYCHRD
jgi:hypothetical protein